VFDLQPYFVAAYADHFVASRQASGRRYRYGQPGPVVAIMSGCAGVLRRLAAALDRWAVGSPDELPEFAPRQHGGAH
jgi:hypothetical protein